MKYLIKTPQGHYLIGQRVPGSPGEKPMPLWTVDLQAAQLFESVDSAYAACVYMQSGFVHEAQVVCGAMFEHPNKAEAARFPVGHAGFGEAGKGGDAIATGRGSIAIGGAGGKAGSGVWKDGVYYGGGGAAGSASFGGSGGGMARSSPAPSPVPCEQLDPPDNDLDIPS